MKTAHEFKVMRIRECVATEMIDTPERAADYWRSNIPQADWFDPAKEAFVVLILNARRRIIGHKPGHAGLPRYLLRSPEGGF